MQQKSHRRPGAPRIMQDRVIASISLPREMRDHLVYHLGGSSWVREQIAKTMEIPIARARKEGP